MAQAESHFTTANFLRNIFQCGNNKHIKTITKNLLPTFVKPMSKLTSTTNITPLATPTIPPPPHTHSCVEMPPHQTHPTLTPTPPTLSAPQPLTTYLPQNGYHLHSEDYKTTTRKANLNKVNKCKLQPRDYSYFMLCLSVFMN